MHDLKPIREDRGGFVKGLTRRGMSDAAKVADDVLARDKSLRELLTRLQTQQARRNDASKLIGQAKQKKDEALAKSLMEEVAGLKDEIQKGEALQRELEEALKQALAVIPNIPAEDVPDGADESANVPVAARAFGKPPVIQAPKQHFEIGEALGQMDFERAAKVSGSRFVYLKGDLAKLERALGGFMLDTHTGKFGYTEVNPPVLVRDAAMFGTGQLPKFKDDQFGAYSTEEYAKAFDEMMQEYETAGGPPDTALKDRIDHFLKRHWLIPTAEVSLTNYVNDEVLA